MSKPQRILTLALWGLTVISMMALIAAWADTRAHRVNVATRWRLSASSQIKPMGYDVPDFTLTDENNKIVTKEELKGQPWIASFIFTRCTFTCPVMSSKMARLQKSISDPRVKLISFTVDPEHDTPEVMKSYAAKFGADPDRWHFLTGPKEKIAEISMGMKLGLQYSSKPTDITHSERFVLIGRDGRVVGYYDGTNDSEVQRLAADASKLASAK